MHAIPHSSHAAFNGAVFPGFPITIILLHAGNDPIGMQVNQPLSKVEPYVPRSAGVLEHPGWVIDEQPVQVAH